MIGKSLGLTGEELSSLLHLRVVHAVRFPALVSAEPRS